MNEADLAAVRERMAGARQRVKTIELAGGGRVVVKQVRPARTVWRSRFVSLLARTFGLSLLQAVPAPGGRDAQAVEVARLHALALAGVAVPRVLHVDRDFIVIGHLQGASLAERIEEGGPEGRAAWRRGLEALVAVHARGGCLSHAFARNFIDTVDGLAMIDFEDDPLIVMTLAEAQARDWLAYLHSTVWMLRTAAGGDADAARATVAATLAAELPEVRLLVEAASHRLAALRFLPRSRRTFGREVVGAQAMAALFPLLPVPVS